MSVLSPTSVFTSLQQHGPFKLNHCAEIFQPYSEHARNWVQELRQDPNNVSKYRALRSQIFEFLGIDCFNEINQLINDIELRQYRSQRALTLVGNMFGIEGTPKEVETRIDEYARTADAVIESLRGKILAPFKSHIETTNEIEMTNNPIDLMLIMFDNNYHKKARFEARRKLILMNLAGSIDQRERETEIESKFTTFLNFLNGYVWSPDLKIGELESVYLHSSHDADDYHCTQVAVISPQQAESATKKVNERFTLLKRRRFTYGSRDIPIYVSIRKKPPEAKVLKLLRKNQKNPAVAVDDELGLMAVLDSIGDIKAFQKHLTRSASHADSLMVLEDISNTLNSNSQYISKAVGSSSKTPMMKFFARLGGMRVEFIIHTNQTWLNYMHQQDVSHNEYEVKRVFDSGVIELLFPKEIFQLDHQTTRNHMLEYFRAQSKS